MKVVWNLDSLLKEKGISAYKLAREAKLSDGTVGAIKNSKSTMVSLETLEKICTVLECKPGELLTIEEDGE